MDYKLKNRDGVETTYTKEKLKIPAATDDSMVVFTQGEAQAEKTVDINANGAFTVEPDAGYSFVKKVSGTVNVPGPDFSQVTATAADVLKDKVFLDSQGQRQIGSILSVGDSNLEDEIGHSHVRVTGPIGYYPNGVDHNVYVGARGNYNLSFENTTYQSSLSKNRIETAMRMAIAATPLVGEPIWMLGLGFQIDEGAGTTLSPVAICTLYATSDSEFQIFGGTDAGAISIRMELSGAVSDNALSYTLNKLQINNMDLTGSINESTPMMIISLVPAD